jgi:hypothetical protein
MYYKYANEDPAWRSALMCQATHKSAVADQEDVGSNPAGFSQLGGPVHDPLWFDNWFARAPPTKKYANIRLTASQFLNALYKIFNSLHNQFESCVSLLYICH